MTTQTNMKRALLFSGALTAIIVGVFSLAYLTAAASNKYPFNGRGIVRENDTVNKIVKIYFTHMSPLARSLALGSTIDVYVNQAKIFKADAAGRMRRVTQGNLVVGEEVVAIGKVRSDDRFVASKVQVNERKFVMNGTMLTYDYDNRRMTVQLSSSSYRPKDYNKATVTITFTSNTQFFSGGRLLNQSDIAASNQKVRVEGKVLSVDEFEATKVFENPS